MEVDQGDEPQYLTLSFIDDEPIFRSGFFMDYYLHINLKGADFTRVDLNKSPLLLNHNSNVQLGRVNSASIKGKKGMADVEFDMDDPVVISAKSKVDKGMLTGVSMGFDYLLKDVRVEESEDDEDTLDVYIDKWELIELSLTPIPADPRVGTDKLSKDSTISKALDKYRQSKLSFVEVEEVTEPVVEEVEEPVVKEDTELDERIKAILALCDEHKDDELFAEAMRDNLSVEDVKSKLLNKIKPALATETEVKATVPAQAKEVHKFNLGAYLMHKIHPDNEEFRVNAGQELEMLSSVPADKRRGATGVFIPHEFLNVTSESSNTRDLIAKFLRGQIREQLAISDASALVNTDVRQSEWIPSVTEVSQVLPFCSVEQGLTGDVSFPSVTTPPAMGMYSGAGGPTDPAAAVMGNVVLTPKKLVARVDLSYVSNIQSENWLERVMMEEIRQNMAQEVDKEVLVGSGASNNVRGVMNLTGITSIERVSNTAVTYAELLGLEKAIIDAKSPRARVVYFLDTDTWLQAKTTPRVGLQWPAIIVEGLDGGESVDGRPSFPNTNLSANNTVAGDFSNFIVGFWGGLDFVFNQQSGTGNWEITAIQLFDAVAKRDTAFAHLSPDSG